MNAAGLPPAEFLSQALDTIERMFAVDDVEWVPGSLDTMEPGHELACVLSTININECTSYDRIRVLKAYERMRSFYSAHLYEAMIAVADAVDPDDAVNLQAEEVAAAEVGAALKWTRHAADNEMEFAMDLRRRLPRVWTALLEGRIDVRRAKALVHATTHLSTAAARTVIDAIIDRAHRYTTGQLQARIRRLCIDANPTMPKNATNLQWSKGGSPPRQMRTAPPTSLVSTFHRTLPVRP